MKAYATFAALYMFLLLTASCAKEAAIAPQGTAPATEETENNELSATTPVASTDGADSGPPSGTATTEPAISDVDMARIWITPEGNFVTE
ncbi:MAG: hypothetical protein KA175_13465 [Flavobacteriales bacterium]|nr:hypothetical protein [Flavobacteriales bacterium]MBP6698623.1 hypothetical protein [Flavobacteriales bacterium]